MNRQLDGVYVLSIGDRPQDELCHRKAKLVDIKAAAKALPESDKTTLLFALFKDVPISDEKHREDTFEAAGNLPEPDRRALIAELAGSVVEVGPLAYIDAHTRSMLAFSAPEGRPWVPLYPWPADHAMIAAVVRERCALLCEDAAAHFNEQAKRGHFRAAGIAKSATLDRQAVELRALSPTDLADEARKAVDGDGGG